MQVPDFAYRYEIGDLAACLGLFFHRHDPNSHFFIPCKDPNSDFFTLPDEIIERFPDALIVAEVEKTLSGRTDKVNLSLVVEKDNTR